MERWILLSLILLSFLELLTRDYSNLIERKHDYNLIGRKEDVEMAKRVDKIIEDILFSMGLEPSKLKQVNLKRSNI